MVSANKLKQTRRINLRVPRWMSCRGRVGAWADARAVRAEAPEKARAEARAEVVTADRELVCRRMSTEWYNTNRLSKQRQPDFHGEEYS